MGWPPIAPTTSELIGPLTGARCTARIGECDGMDGTRIGGMESIGGRAATSRATGAIELGFACAATGIEPGGAE